MPGGEGRKKKYQGGSFVHSSGREDGRWGVLRSSGREGGRSGDSSFFGRRSPTPSLLPSDSILRSRRSKMGGSSIFGSEDRRLKMGGSSIFGSEDRRWGFSIFGSEERRKKGVLRRTPSLLRRISPFFEKPSPFFLRSSGPKIEEPPHLRPSEPKIRSKIAVGPVVQDADGIVRPGEKTTPLTLQTMKE